MPTLEKKKDNPCSKEGAGEATNDDKTEERVETLLQDRPRHAPRQWRVLDLPARPVWLPQVQSEEMASIQLFSAEMAVPKK